MDDSIFTLVQIVNIVLLVMWIFLIIYAIKRLKMIKQFQATEKALWALVIILVPIFGPIAFLTIHPAHNFSHKGG